MYFCRKKGKLTSKLLSFFMKLPKNRSIKRLLLIITTVCLTTAACTFSGKDKRKDLTSAKEETEVISSEMPERADALLPRKDSIALAKLYDDYEKSVMDLHDHSEILDEEYERKLKKIRTDFEQSLADNPHFAPAVELRNLLIAYQKEKDKDEEHKYDVELELDEDMPKEIVTHEQDVHFQEKWDEKMVKLLQDHPGFMECPPYMFDEALASGFLVATSSDGRIRYYSYIFDQWRNYVKVKSIRQYRADSGRIIVSLHENCQSHGFVEEVYPLIVDGKTVYLLEKTHNEGYYCYTYHAEAIEGEEITHPVIFDTKNNEEPYVLYNLRGPQKEWVAKYDEKKKTIYMRVTDEDDNYCLNSAYVTYSFDGKMFRLSGHHNE